MTHKLRMGVLGCSEFAGRAMLPAIKDTQEMELTAIASREAAKARSFTERFGGEAVEGYEALLKRPDVDAVYIPLPNSLHAEWVSKSLDAGKHVLVEKSFVPDGAAAERVLKKARKKKLLVMENFLFPYHSQFAWIRERLARSEIGDVRLFRSTFTVPTLKPENIRYQAKLGGGALLDLGTYNVRFARIFLRKPKLLAATLRKDPAKNVDISGSAQFVNSQGQVAQTAWGFDTHYQNIWEFLGTSGKLVVERAYTPPPGFTPTVRVERLDGSETITLPADNHCLNICRYFAHATSEASSFEKHWDDVAEQAKYLGQVRAKAVLL